MTFQEYLNKRHEIINNCDRCLLTESQRDKLLDKIDAANSDYFEAAIEIGKLKSVIESAYEDHSNGSITLSQREKVVNSVRDRIATITEAVDATFNDRYMSYTTTKNLSDEEYARECVDYLYENKFIMESEALELFDIIDMNFISESLSEDLTDIEDSIFSEGANLDARRLFKNAMSEINPKLKKLKMLMKSKDLAPAKKLITELMNDYAKLHDEIKRCESGSGFISYLLGGVWVALGMSLKHILLAFIPIVGPAASIILYIKDVINHNLMILNNVKKSKKDEITLSDINLYKNKLLIIIKEHVTILKKMEKEINKIDKTPVKDDE